MTRLWEVRAWAKHHLGLLQVVEAAQLNLPIAVSWDSAAELLEVQVHEADYRQWMEAVSSPVLESKPQTGHGTTHLFATGELTRCRMVRVRVVAVMHTVGELPEVGSR